MKVLSSVSCTVCGKPITDEAYVVAGRRKYHLHHEGTDHIKTEEYESIIKTLKKQMEYSELSIEEKNKLMELSFQNMEKLKKEIEDLQVEKEKVINEGHRLFSEKGIIEQSHNRVKTELVIKDETISKKEEIIADLLKAKEVRTNTIEELNKEIFVLREDKIKSDDFRKKIKNLGTPIDP